MSFKVFPYKQGSASAKKLAEALDGKVLKINGSKYRPRIGDIVVNWGTSVVPDFQPATTLNPDVRNAQCKLETLVRLVENRVRCPLFVKNKEEVAELGYPVVCRTKLRGHSGDGIVIANNADELVDAPLYTKYIKKKDEYRVHVIKNPNAEFDYHPFFVQRKARKLDNDNPNWQVRNLAGGFVFVETAIQDVPQDVIDQAVAAIEALGLDFGGVDVVWNEKERAAYVLEINTACGLEDRTADRYRQEISNLVEG